MIYFVCLLFSFYANAETMPKDFSSVTCPPADVIAKSYLTLETDGLRISDKCIDRAAYPYLNLLSPPRSAEEGVPVKVQTAVETRPFTIDKITATSAGHFRVAFRYHLQSGLVTKDLADTLRFDTLEGSFKKQMGCALLATPPQHLVTRKNCGR